MRYVVSAVILSLAVGAYAQTAPQQDRQTPPPQKQGAQSQLQSAYQGQADSVFDGVMRRREGAVEVVSEQDNVLLKEEHIPSHRECDYSDAGVYDGPGHGHPGIGRVCSTIPAHVTRTYGDIQTVHVVDREGYVDEAKSKWGRNGALIGGGIGLLGLLSCIALGPWGLLVAAGTVAAGALIGWAAGRKVAGDDAKNTPDVYTRTTNKREVDSAS
jgi:hypothetical protein